MYEFTPCSLAEKHYNDTQRSFEKLHLFSAVRTVSRIVRDGRANNPRPCHRITKGPVIVTGSF